jgi:histone H3/H4
MPLTESQAISIFKKCGIPYSTDAIQALCKTNITDTEILWKITKAAFYTAAKFNRKTVTAEDIEKVAAEMHK